MLTAKANNQTKTIDAAIPELTITYTGFGNSETKTVLDVLPTATTTATASSPVGQYAITVAGGSDNNYDFTYVEGTLTITEKTIPEITWANPASSVYGSAIGTSVMNAQASTAGTFTYSFAADSIFNAGTYQLNVEFVPTDNVLYESTQASVEYTVTKATITAKAVDKVITLGAAIPTLTINYSGFVNDETIGVINALPTATTTATSSSVVGDYPITVSGGSDNNYAFTYVAGTLTITDKMVPEITWTSPESSVYGTSIGETAMNAEATIAGTFVYTFTADSIFDAGTYQLGVSFTPDNTTEYVSVNESVEYTVTKATLTVTANNDTIFVGTEIPELTFDINGFVNNEDESVLNVVPVATTSADVNSPVGTYEIIVSGGSDNNYKFTYVNGTLVIKDGNGLIDNSSLAVSVYPNPAKDLVNLTNVANTTVKVFDITGQLIFTENVVSETSQINVSEFKQGIYVINITNDMGTVSKRLIIE
jgi:general stress protein 26